MPGPDPSAISMHEEPDGRLVVTSEMAFFGNRSARIARAIAILRNLQRGGWCCSWCRGPVPLFRRADARFCGESCRKKAARSRRP